MKKMGRERDFFIIVVFVCLSVCLLHAAPGNDISPVRLPPLADGESSGADTVGWQVTGTIPGAPVIAARDFGLCLNRQGWYRHSRIVMGSGAKAIELTRWAKGGKRLLLMLWESGAGETRFTLGEEKQETK